jgi:hypothetical protein
MTTFRATVGLMVPAETGFRDEIDYHQLLRAASISINLLCVAKSEQNSAKSCVFVDRRGEPG